MGFFSNLTGGDSRRDIRRSKKKSDQLIREGYDEATGFYDEAFDLFAPYAETGQEANRLYSQAIGLGTDEERSAAQERYFSDPAMSAILGQETNRLLKQLNARGQTYGGTAALAGTRAGLEGYNRWLDRVGNLGSQGGQYTGQQAAIRTGQGDLRYGLGATLAGNEINAGNAIAQTRNTGINNLLGFAGTAAKVASAIPSDIRLKCDIIEIGSLPSGLPVYEYSYIWGPERYVGVMAHEAGETFPEAISYSDDGFAMVDYARIS